jgi:hypothetical protein
MCVWRCDRLTYAVAGQSRSRLWGRGFRPVAIAPASLYSFTGSFTALRWRHVCGAGCTALLSAFRPLLPEEVQNLWG